MYQFGKKSGFFSGHLLILLIASLIGNWLIFSQAQQFYTQLRATRLDPQGLRAYPPHGQGIADSDKTRVVFFGDSRAAQWPTAQNSSQFQFINRGIDAQTSTQVRQRLEVHILPLNADVVILQVGINDLTSIPLFPDRKEHIVSTVKENISWIVNETAVSPSQPTIIMTTIFPTGEIPLIRQPFWSSDIEEAIVEVNNYIATLANENIVVMDSYGLLVDDNGRLANQYARDKLHLSTAGYTLLNKNLTQILQENVVTP